MVLLVPYDGFELAAAAMARAEAFSLFTDEEAVAGTPQAVVRGGAVDVDTSIVRHLRREA